MQVAISSGLLFGIVSLVGFVICGSVAAFCFGAADRRGIQNTKRERGTEKPVAGLIGFGIVNALIAVGGGISFGLSVAKVFENLQW